MYFLKQLSPRSINNIIERVFHWALCDNKSLQFPELLSVFCPILMLQSEYFLLSSYLHVFQSIYHPFGFPTACITFTFMFHSIFSSQAKSRYLFLFSFSLFSFCDLASRQSPLFGWLSFFLDSHEVCSSVRDRVFFFLYLKIPKICVRLIHQNEFLLCIQHLFV